MLTVNLVLTDAGYAASLRAERTGQRIRPVTFQVTQYSTDYVPSRTQSALLGTVLYEGSVGASKATENLDLVYRLDIPDTSIPGTIYEVGLYTADGTLMAVGVLPDRYTKIEAYQLRFYAYLRAPADNQSVEFEANVRPVLPVVDNYVDLPPANVVGPNVWVVRNGHRSNGPCIVCKYRNGDEWALVGGSIVYQGPILDFDSTAGASVLIEGLDSLPDYAFLYVRSGSGKGEARKVVWSNEALVFSDQNMTTVLDATTNVVVWAGPGYQ